MSKKALYFIGIGVLSIFFFCLFYYAIDFPQYDDYDSILNNTRQADHTNGISQKLGFLFKFHNEHIIFPLRGFSLFQLYVLGGIDFRLYCYLGGLGICIIGYLYYLNIQKIKYPELALLLVFLITFIPLYDVTNWAMVSVVNVYVLVFAFATFHFLQYDTVKTTLASGVCQFMATFSLGGGFASFLVGLFMLHKLKTKNKILWLGIGIFNLAIYFYLMSFRTGRPKRIPSNLEEFSDLATHFFYFFGSIFQGIFPRGYFLVFLGLLLFGLIVFHYLRKDKIFQLNALEAFLLYLVINVAFASISRYFIDFKQAGSFRYQPIHMNIILCLSLIYLNKDFKQVLSTRIQYFILLLACLFYSFKLNLNLSLIQKRYSELQLSILNFEAGDKDFPVYPLKLKGKRTQNLAEMYKRMTKKTGFLKQNYSAKEILDNQKFHPVSFYEETRSDKFRLHIDHINNIKPDQNLEIEGKVLIVRGWCFNETQKKAPEEFYVELDSVYYRPFKILRKPGVRKICGSPDCLMAGFETYIGLHDLPAGSHTLRFYAVDHSTKTKTMLKKQLKFSFKGTGD